LRAPDEKQTIASFEYQWEMLPAGASLLSDSEFKLKAAEYICEEFSRPPDWFKGKMVLDAGCGNGRWSYGFARLGCNVVSMDVTTSGCKSTYANVRDAAVIRADIFYIPLRPKLFDVAFSWGVLHHTGDKLRAFQSVAQMSKRGGVLHIYVYGPKSKRFIFWKTIISSIHPLRLRHFTVTVLTSAGRLAPSLWRRVGFTQSEHTNFDAYSPRIADRTSMEEAVRWFETQGFSQIEKCFCAWDKKRLSTDIYLQGIAP
jgi:SAM-dependent methyltransferase